MAGEFEDKVVVVTGGGRGIGMATAKAFAREGARVVVADVNGDSAAQVAAAIEADGGVATGIRTDVSDPAQCQAMVDHAVSHFGGLHIAVNNAGVRSPPTAEFEQLELDAWHRVIDINLNGVFYCMKAEVPALRASGGTAIINTCSAASFIAAPSIPAYIASKHGLAGLTKAAAIDLIRHGIRVNAIAPGATEAGMLGRDEQMGSGASEAMIAMQPIRRLAQLEELANGILYLASDKASFMVGSLVRIDGGMTLG
jgi:NAD(P)-dependent dehydrogenase (short-subunit alcohol dehydrogenase family)